LIRLFSAVVKEYDCTVLCGHRNKAEQDEAFAKGNSRLKFPHSMHNRLPSLAVDVVLHPLPDWKDIPKFDEFAKGVKRIAQEMNIKIECGADWPRLRDYPHFQLTLGDKDGQRTNG
jgi:peptidoglycan L-alanyl-D-glutamate endopeptidase CwlK